MKSSSKNEATGILVSILKVLCGAVVLAFAFVLGLWMFAPKSEPLRMTFLLAMTFEGPAIIVFGAVALVNSRSSRIEREDYRYVGHGVAMRRTVVLGKTKEMKNRERRQGVVLIIAGLFACLTNACLFYFLLPVLP